MFPWLWPVEIEDRSLVRAPRVSIALVLVTLLLSIYAAFIHDGSTARVAFYWFGHPYLELPQELQDRLSESERRRLEQIRELPLEQPSISERAQQQAELDRRWAAAKDIEAFAFVPSRGFVHRGLVTHIVLEENWLMLLGLLFSFYIVGPYLEDRWGHAVFFGFCVLGGMVNAAAYSAFNPSSNVPLFGPYGAVMACVGAASLRFLADRVRFLFLFWIILRPMKPFTWRFGLPVWLCATLTLLGEGWLIAVTEGAEQSKFLAHLGAFGFGAVFAVGMRLTKLERDEVEPATGETVISGRGTDNGSITWDNVDREKTRKRLGKALAKDRTNLEAAFGLARIHLEEGDPSAATRVIGPALNAALASNDEYGLELIVEELGDTIDPAALPASVAYRFGRRLEAIRPLAALHAYEVVSTVEGGLAGKAMVQAAELLLARRDPTKAKAMAERALASTVLDDVATRARSVIEKAQASAIDLVPTATGLSPNESVMTIPLATDEVLELDPGFGANTGSVDHDGERTVELHEDSTRGPQTPPDEELHELDLDALLLDEGSEPATEILTGQFAGRSPNGLRVQLANGGPVDVSLDSIVSVAFSVVAQADGRSRPVLVLDLALAPQLGKRSVLRFFSDAMGLNTLYAPATPPAEALRTLMQAVLERASALPPADASQIQSGQYPRFNSLIEHDAAFYG